LEPCQEQRDTSPEVLFLEKWVDLLVKKTIKYRVPIDLESQLQKEEKELEQQFQSLPFPSTNHIMEKIFYKLGQQ
jgi:hypothetical protein